MSQVQSSSEGALQDWQTLPTEIILPAAMYHYHDSKSIVCWGFPNFLSMTDMTSGNYSRMLVAVLLPSGAAWTYHARLAVPIISSPSLIMLASQLSAAAAGATWLELLLCALKIKKEHPIWLTELIPISSANTVFSVWEADIVNFCPYW